MHISLIKVSEEFNNVNGRHLWLTCGVVVNEGEDESVAFKKAMDSIIKANEVASERPSIPVIERFAITQKEADIEFDLIKSQVEAFEFREDAQAFIETTDWKFAIEIKPYINKKPLKHEKK